MKRDKREKVDRNRRKKPYTYSYEVGDAAKEKGITTHQLRDYINERSDDIKGEI